VPELPEVETVRRQLAPVVGGRRVLAAGAFPSPKFDAAVAATGSTLGAVGRRGKYLLVDLDDDRELVVHLGMTGRLGTAEGAVPDPASPEDPYLRAWWALDDGHLLTFHDTRRFGRIAVVPRGRYGGLPTLEGLGPEPWDPELTDERFWRSLRASSRRVKTQLLSQVPIAGVGNIYADEALWRAGVHPAARRLTRSQAARLLVALRDVLAEGVEHGGTTLRDYRTVDGRAGAHQAHLDCYGRAGAPCSRCATPLRARVYDARTTTWCPVCQRR
jgi:formamidopyrimidine-DNA glycosylase